MGTVKTGFVAVIGATNAGKSTLVNSLVGEKVGIVSSRPQTTRQRVVGILSGPQWQLALVDAPGFVQASSGLNAFLQLEAAQVASDADLILAVFPADEIQSVQHLQTLKQAQRTGKPILAVITKDDLDCSLATRELLAVLSENNIPSVRGSHLNNGEVWRKDLIPLIVERLPEQEQFLFDTDLYTTQSVREMAGELIREKAFEFLHQEIPYGLAVKVNLFKEGPLTRIQADLWVAKENHRGIVIGAQGQNLKRIGSAARVELEKLMGGKVYLELFVKIQKNWMRQAHHMKELGYVIHN